MAPTNIKLYYFNIRGRAEVLRWVLAQAGAQFEDMRLQGESWQAMKSKIPTGQMPYLETSEVKLSQTGAIAFYLGREFGLLGDNSVQSAQIHMMYDCVQDVFTARAKAAFCKDPEEKERLTKDFRESVVPKLAKIMEAMLGDKSWLVGNKVSLADIYAACVLKEIDHEVYKDFPKACDLVKRVTDLPNIKKWISGRPESNM